jgi:adenine-specific DNA-methyltransferase
MNYLYKKRFKSTKRVFSEIQARSVGQLPILIPLPSHVRTISILAELLISGKARGPVEKSSSLRFLDDLIDACVMECYFCKHMADRDLLFLDDLASQLTAYEPDASESRQHDFIEQLYGTLNMPTSRIRNRLLRISADSPDLLAVIKVEGKA